MTDDDGAGSQGSSWERRHPVLLTLLIAAAIGVVALKLYLRSEDSSGHHSWATIAVALGIGCLVAGLRLVMMPRARSWGRKVFERRRSGR